MARSYRGDPYWTTARFASTCACTKHGRVRPDGTVPPVHEVTKGERIFYYPRTKSVYAGACGDAASRDFESCAFDEDVMGRGC